MSGNTKTLYSLGISADGTAPSIVNNAAIVEYIPFDVVDDAAFARLFQANVRAPIKTVQAVLPVIRNGGRIINISSRSARVAMGGLFTLYAATKASLEVITKGLATEYSTDKKITVNNVMPGPVDTGTYYNARSLPTEHFRFLADKILTFLKMPYLPFHRKPLIILRVRLSPKNGSVALMTSRRSAAFWLRRVAAGSMEIPFRPLVVWTCSRLLLGDPA